MKALHTLDTRTLLMSTALLISSGKYHSYFASFATLSGSNSETLPAPSGGRVRGVYPHKALKVLPRDKLLKSQGGIYLIKGPMEA